MPEIRSGDEKTKIYGANELRRKELGRVEDTTEEIRLRRSENIFVYTYIYMYKIFPV